MRPRRGGLASYERVVSDGSGSSPRNLRGTAQLDSGGYGDFRGIR